ncbi:MAG: zf-TFIIB domain-containing protein [Solirubrobacterales bacterium]|nr:zf-TFIIB domain-containing protein [Solirubrobacterales bacterium]
MTDPLSCPKCGSSMRSYERNQVVVDQCSGCGGLFLDRGELERLVEAESSFYESRQPRSDQPRSDDRDRDERRHDDRHHHDDRHRKPKKKSKRSFLEDFLEF